MTPALASALGLVFTVAVALIGFSVFGLTVTSALRSRRIDRIEERLRRVEERLARSEGAEQVDNVQGGIVPPLKHGQDRKA